MTITPDLNRIVPYTMADDNRAKATTIREYSNGKQSLLYINASHVRGENNPTTDTIKEAIEQYKPQRVIIEAENGRSLNEGSEVAYADAMAKQHGIAVLRGEPDDKAVFEQIGAKGYSAKDVMALYLLRKIPQDRQMGHAMDEAHFAERAQQYLTSAPTFDGIPAQQRLSYEEFKKDYVPRLEHADFLQATTNDFAPFEHEGASYFQKLNAAVGSIREENLNTVIAGALNDVGEGKVLVVYGGGHRTISEPVWEHALGKGVDLHHAKAAHAAKDPLQALISGHELEKDTLAKLSAAQKSNSPDKDRLKDQWANISLDNLRMTHAYVQEHGWPAAAQHGAVAEHAAWLNSQHGDANFALPRDKWDEATRMQADILGAMQAGGANPGYTAFLTDRVLRNSGQPQRYGTQFAPHPDFPDKINEMEDPLYLDIRRLAAGLKETRGDYMARIKAEADVGIQPLPFRKIIENEPALMAQYDQEHVASAASGIEYRADWSKQDRNQQGRAAIISRDPVS